MAVVERLLGSFDHMLRCAEIWLADAEIDHLIAFAGDFVSTRQHLEGTFCAEPPHTVVDLEV